MSILISNRKYETKYQLIRTCSSFVTIHPPPPPQGHQGSWGGRRLFQQTIANFVGMFFFPLLEKTPKEINQINLSSQFKYCTAD